MKILITGTAGFIGFHLARRLVQKGFEVVGLDNINNYYDVNLKYERLNESGIVKEEIVYNKLVKSRRLPRYQFIQLNLEDEKNLELLFKKENFDCVCNLAAQAGIRYSILNPKTYIQGNIVGFYNILECCRTYRIKHLVYASSSSVYGLNETMPLKTSQGTNHPISLYAASKKSNELMAHTYSHLFNIPTTGVRFFTVYGPWGRPDMAYFLFTKAILEKDSIKVYNHGNMLRDFTYIDDIIRGLELIISQPPSGNENWDGMNPNPSNSKAPYKLYNLGNSKPIKLLDFIEAIERELKVKANKQYLDLQPGDVLATYADVSDLVKDFDFKPKTALSYGIQQFTSWYIKFFYPQIPNQKIGEVKIISTT